MVVKLSNVVKTYKGGVKALNNMSYEVRNGEIYGLLGPNGCGKTTSINCLLSLLEFDSGEIEIFGQKMSPSRYDLKKRIGVVPQNVAVFDELTVYENIDYFCSLYVKDKALRKQYVEEAIDFVDLKDYVKFYPKKLSGGLLRRLNIACGISHKPELIIFDEPTVAVDPQSRNKILDNIKKLNEQGATIIYTSHYMEEVEQLCSYIVIVDKGEIIAHGTKEKLKSEIKLGSTMKIEMLDNNPEYINLIKDIEGIKNVSMIDNILNITTKENYTFIPEVITTLKDNKIEFKNVYSYQPSLNDVFLEMTGKELRD